MKILLTGAAGRLGHALQRQLAAQQHEVIGADIVGAVQHKLDITDYSACRELIEAVAPDILLHPAAWTDVNGCALQPQKALLINGVGTQHLAALTAGAGIPILYVSTNEVFDGAAGRPYTEYDRTKPINPYGYSKCYGERALVQVNPQHYIVRTAWLFAHGGRNFIQAILAAAAAGKALRVVTNEVANPTYCEDLAAAIAQLIQSGRYGIYHFVNEGAVSRWHFARFLLDEAGFADRPIARISRHEWPRPSLPPEYTPLANIAGASIPSDRNAWLGQPFGLMFHALDDLRAHEVYICTGGSPSYALWGGLMSTRARQLGAAGAVLHGYSRDTQEILHLNFPTFSYGGYAQDQGPRGKVVDFRIPIELGGVRIAPGDIVFGDIDGLCIVPQAAVAEVFQAALEKARGEQSVRQALLAGMSTVEAFEKYGIM